MEATIILIENNQDYRRAMDVVSNLMLATDPKDLARLNAQAREVEAYEAKRWPQELATVPDILQYLMEQHDMTREDLAPLVGGIGKVSEILNGKRRLSLNTIMKLRERFGVSADVLLPREDRIRATVTV